MLQLLKGVIHRGEIKPLGGWQAVAFATRALGRRIGHSTSTNSVNPFQPRPAQGTQVLIDKQGVCLCSEMMINC